MLYWAETENVCIIVLLFLILVGMLWIYFCWDDVGCGIIFKLSLLYWAMSSIPLDSSGLLSEKHIEICQRQLFLHLILYQVVSEPESVCVVDYIYWFIYSEISLYLCNEAVLIMVHNLFDAFEFGLWVFCGEFVYLCSSERSAYNFLFPFDLCLTWWKKIWKCSFLFYFAK